MQIHELNNFAGTPTSSDYLAIDNSTTTTKIGATGLGVQDKLTVAEAETGTSTASRIVTPKVVHDYVTGAVSDGIDNITTSATKTKWSGVTGGDGSINDSLNHIADCTIVESGTSGNWYYRKWSNGTAECWMNKKENLAMTTWGSLYYVRMDADSYPTGLFTEVISVVAQFASSIDMVASARNQGEGRGENLSTTTPPGILGIRPTSGNPASYTGMWYAIGKWK